MYTCVTCKYKLIIYEMQRTAAPGRSRVGDFNAVISMYARAHYKNARRAFVLSNLYKVSARATILDYMSHFEFEYLQY